MRTIFSSLLLGCLCVPVCLAQNSWPEYVQHWTNAHPDRSPWTLIVQKGSPLDALRRRDEGIVLLQAEHDLGVEALDAEQAQVLWEARGWSPGPHWLLLNRKGDTCFEGTETPSGDDVRSSLLSAGYKPAWDLREAFLKEHPENGDALNARLRTSLALVNKRFWVLVQEGKASRNNLTAGVPGKLLLDPEAKAIVADEICKETVETLERLILLPDWWRFSDRFMLGLFLQSYDLGASRRLRSVLFRMRDSLLQEWRKNPHSGGGDGKTFEEANDIDGLGTIWFQCERALEDGRITALPLLSPSPGRIWPHEDLVHFAWNLFWLSSDWEAGLSFLGMIPMEYPEAPIAPEHWGEFLSRQTVIAAHFANAYAHLGRWEQAKTALLEARRWAGPRWKQLLLAYEFDQLQEGGSAPQEPTAGLLGRPKVIAPKAFFDIFASPQEPELPAPSSIPEGLQSPQNGPAALLRLSKFIRHNPDHMDARRDRYALIRALMPDPALEGILAEDASTAWIALNFRKDAKWISDPALWEIRAKKLLPELEAAIRRWPTSPKPWRTWLTWSAFLPTPKSPYSFAQSIDVWGPRSQWLAALPKEVHEAVAKDLRKTVRYGLMREWFQDAWNGVNENSGPLLANGAERNETIYRCLAETLMFLNQKSKLVELERQHKDLLKRNAPAPQ